MDENGGKAVTLVRLTLITLLLLISAAWGQNLPPVYFNHAAMFMDKAVLDDVASSAFLKEEFSSFDSKTIQRDGGKWSYTATFIHGTGTYFEFLPASGKGVASTQSAPPVGAVSLGM
jgi:hypothetical protein